MADAVFRVTATDGSKFELIHEENSGDRAIKTSELALKTDAPELPDITLSSIEGLEDALESKVVKETGKGLSSNDFTNALLTKLNGIAAGAQTNTVDSVAGKTGAVTLTATDVGLDNVNNTSDANKPISTATQTALNAKVDKEAGKGLSSNDFTTAEKNKLASLESSKFLGQYVTLAELNATHSAAAIGSYAFVDGGVGENVVKYIWDSSDNKFVPQQGETAELTPAQVKSLYESNPDTYALNESMVAAIGTIGNKVDKEAGKGLSANDFTNALLTKLNGIAAGAQVNTVTSVAGKTGAVSVTASDVGLGNVNNTSDANKPISTATQTALNAKAALKGTASVYGGAKFSLSGTTLTITTT